MTQLASPPSDTLSDVLRSFEVRSTIFCLSELRAPWAFRVEGEAVAKFHLVLEGSALLSWGKETVALATGDLVVLPRGSAHTLADDADSPAVPLERLLVGDAFDGESGLRYGGAGLLTRLLCGGSRSQTASLSRRRLSCRICSISRTTLPGHLGFHRALRR